MAIIPVPVLRAAKLIVILLGGATASFAQTSESGSVMLRDHAGVAVAELLGGSASRGRTGKRDDIALRFASRYLELWSAPRQVTLATASSFYTPVVTFHGRRRTVASVVAEKRRFVARWPHRVYRHRPDTTEVSCENKLALCTVRASFDFETTNAARERRSLGVGEHELVVDFSSGNPLITAENSRVIIRGHGNTTSLLEEGF